jgi:hypothetical protein
MKPPRFRIAWIMVAVAIVALALVPIVRYQRNAWLEARAKARLAELWDSASSSPFRPSRTNKINAVFRETSNAVKAAIAPDGPTAQKLGD